MTKLKDGTAEFKVINKSQKALIDLLYPIGIIITTGTDTAKKPGEAEGLAAWIEVAQNRVLQGSGSGAGQTVEPGLPNIKGSILGYGDRMGFGGEDGAFSATHKQNRIPSMGDEVPGYTSDVRIEFDASRSNSIYGKSTTVQPPAYKVHFWKRIK